jgi:hypothetical protein
MKMVKSLLLSSAAGLLAVGGAQAADLPVKAKAVEYVKICSLYGAGYYYIPGTDTCIKLGGYVRYEAYHNSPGGQYATGNAAGYMNRHTNVWSQHARWRLTADVRSQTEYGTLRSYWSVGFNYHNGPDSLTAAASSMAFERAFIQFAGFTFGRAESMYAFYNGAAYSLVPTALDGSTGPGGINIAAYTAQFGNGVSATISLEDSQNRQGGVVDASLMTATGVVGTTGAVGFGISAVGTGTSNAAAATGWYPGANDAAGNRTPDIVGNIRVDQAWGSAQIMGALHEVGGRYYTQDLSGVNCPNPGVATPGNVQNTTMCGSPDDKWGWAVGAGLTLKMPWNANDTLSGMISYSKGATRYVAHLNQNTLLHKEGVAVGAYNDAVFGTPTAYYDGSLQLTESWGGTIAFEHYWTPALRQSIIFGYQSVSFNDTVKASLTSCLGSPNAGVADGTLRAGCDPDWSMWRLGSRVMWNPVQNLDVGVEVFYSKVNTAFAGQTIAGNAAQGLGGNTYIVQDENLWSAAFRVQRNFWP